MVSYKNIGKPISWNDLIANEFHDIGINHIKK